MNTALQLPEAVSAPAAAGWRRWLVRSPFQRAARSLRLIESLPLGERRFVAIVQAGGRQFLIGGTPQSLALLSELDPSPALPTPPAGGVQ